MKVIFNHFSFHCSDFAALYVLGTQLGTNFSRCIPAQICRCEIRMLHIYLSVLPAMEILRGLRQSADLVLPIFYLRVPLFASKQQSCPESTASQSPLRGCRGRDERCHTRYLCHATLSFL